MRLGTVLVALALLMGAMAGQAPADQLKTFNVNNGQNVAVELCDGEDTTGDGYGVINYTGSTHFAAGDAVNLTVTPGAAAQAQGITATVHSTITIPSPWNREESPRASFTLDIPGTTTLGTYAIGASATNGSYTVTDGFNLLVRCTVISQSEDDTAAPVITLTTPPDQAVYVLGAEVAADYTCEDAVDPEPSCDGDVDDGALIDTSTPGENTFTVSSEDASGNSDSVTHTYTVIFAGCGGMALKVLQPVNTDGSSVFKQGSTVPVKFRACDAAANPVDANVVAGFNRVSVTPGVLGGVNETTTVATASHTEFRWSADGQQWVFNLGTRNLTSGKTYSHEIVLTSDQVIPVTFGVK